MKQQKKFVVFRICFLAIVFTGILMAQPPEKGEGTRRGDFDPKGMRSAEERRERMAQMIKEYLDINDDAEWKVLQPRLEKVIDLRQQTEGMGRGMMMLFGRGRRPNRGPAADTQGEKNAIEKASDELQTLLDANKAEPEKIKNALTVLRQARDQAKQELAKAQAELKKNLTLQQEAKLVLVGYLN
jgi:hypothetical protein